MNNVINYQKELYKLIENIKIENKKPKLLLHVCCCPCFLIPFEILRPFFKISIFYFNPNIYPFEEYQRRKQELIDYIKIHKLNDVKFIECEYDNELFTSYLLNHKDDKEGHERCRICFRKRLTYMFDYASIHNFDYVGTVMSISRYKNAQDLNSIGFDLEKSYGNVKWLPADFKKNNGYEKELILCKKYNLYFQKYCGCMFSYFAFLAKKDKH